MNSRNFYQDNIKANLYEIERDIAEKELTDKQLREIYTLLKNAVLVKYREDDEFKDEDYEDEVEGYDYDY